MSDVQSMRRPTADCAISFVGRAGTCPARRPAAAGVNRSIGVSADVPATSPFQKTSVPQPNGLTTPTPVTATREPSLTPHLRAPAPR
jgi:hypothetical protein